jgi:hypothetical protein
MRGVVAFLLTPLAFRKRQCAIAGMKHVRRCTYVTMSRSNVSGTCICEATGRKLHSRKATNAARTHAP